MAMSEKVEQFFNDLDEKEQFLFYRLYNHPDSVLGKKQDMNEAEEEYYNLYNYFDLMLNNNYSKFISAVCYDVDFKNRCENNDQIWRKLHFFLWDSIDFKKYYCICLDKDLVDVLENRMPVNNYLKEKIPPFPILEAYDAWGKYKKLFENNYSIEKVESYDLKSANKARADINFVIQCIMEKISKRNENELILSRIAQEDCSIMANEESFLFRYSLNTTGLDTKVLDSLVCENRFLRIINQKLANGCIGGLSLRHALQIITTSIEVKRHLVDDYSLYEGRLGQKKIQEFDLEFAEMLVNGLIEYKKRNEETSKIIRIGSLKDYNS